VDYGEILRYSALKVRKQVFLKIFAEKFNQCTTGSSPASVIAAPVFAAPVIAVPVIAAPVIAAPVFAAPVIAAPVFAAPVIAAPDGQFFVGFSALIFLINYNNSFFLFRVFLRQNYLFKLFSLLFCDIYSPRYSQNSLKTVRFNPVLPLLYMLETI
jgi:hypothetical protein